MNDPEIDFVNALFSSLVFCHAGSFSFPTVPPNSDLEYELELLEFDPVSEVQDLPRSKYTCNLLADLQNKRGGGAKIYKYTPLDNTLMKQKPSRIQLALDNPTEHRWCGFHLRCRPCCVTPAYIWQTSPQVKPLLCRGYKIWAFLKKNNYLTGILRLRGVRRVLVNFTSMSTPNT